MKKQTLLLFLFSWMFGLSSLFAEEVSPYELNFDNIENTGSKAFEEGWVPASGWNHLVKKSGYGEAFSYYGDTSNGVNGSGCVRIGAMMDYNYDYYNPGDALISPLVSGDISIQVKSNSYQAGIAIYKYTLVSGEWVQGQQLVSKDMSNGLIRDQFVEVTCSLDEASYIGIVAYQSYIDDFKATKADIVKEQKVKMTVTTSPEKDYVDADADGNFSVSFGLTIKNIGDIDVDDPTKTIKLVNADNESIVFDTKTFPTLFVGEESDELTFTANINTTDYQPVAFRFIEDATGTTLDAMTIKPIICQPVITMQVQSGYNYTELKEDDTVDFGTSQKAVVRNFKMKNDGGAAFNISNVTLPEGYSTSLTNGTTVNPHSELAFTVTKDEGTAGKKEGNMTIEGESNIIIPLTGETVDENAWYIDFEDRNIPADVNTQNGDWTVNSINYSLGYTNNTYMVQSPLYTEPGKFISPLLEVNEGDVLKFDAAKLNNNSFINVYYSADRKNWTFAKAVRAVADEEGVDEFETNSTSGYYTYYYFKTHEVSNIPAGQWYIAFEAGSANMDNIIGFKKVDVEKDFFIQKNEIPETGEVNKSYKAKLTVKNSSLNNVEEGTYSAKLFFDNKLMAEAKGAKLKAGESTELTLEFIPHLADTYTARIDVEGGVNTVSTDEVNVVVSDEQLNNDVQVGTVADGLKIQSSPINPTYNSEGEVVYPAELLARYGLKSGDKINKVTLLGTNAGNYSGATTFESKDLTVTIGNSDDSNLYTPANEKTTTNSMTIHEGPYTYPVVGEYKNYSYTGYGKLIEINIEGEPFEYTGGSIVLHLKNTVESSAYSYTGFVADKAETYHSIERQTYGDASQLPSISYSNYNLPVTMFGVIGESQSISGKVTDTEGNDIKNAEVTLTSGDVEYSAMTNASGKYSINVIKSKLNYQMKVTKAGYIPFVKEDVSFEAGSLVQDVTLEEATSLFINKTEIPANGEVNNKLVAHANILNPLTMNVKAADYTARLIVDNEEGATAETIDIRSMEYKDLTFCYTPHTAGIHKAFVELKHGENTVTSETFDINVAEESLGGYYQVLDSTSMSSAGPISTGSVKYENQTIYTAEQLGIPEGSVIKSLEYRGYVASGYFGDVNTDTHVKVWIENTDMDTDYSSDEYANVAFDINSADPAYETDLHFETKGSSDSLFVMLNVPLNFKYTGKNLRIVMYQQIDENSSSSSYVYWMVDNKVHQTYNRQAYNFNQELGTWSTYSYAPVVYITADRHADIEGKVTDFNDNPVEGAEVKIENGDVYYTATTDAEGKYNITVAQLQYDYKATATAEGYQPAVIDQVELVGGESSVLNIQLHTLATLNGIITDAETGETIENANISIMQGDDEVAAAVSEANGEYSLEVNDAENEYTVVVNAEGYMQKKMTITLANGEMVQNIELEKTRNTLSGTVTVVDKPGDTPRPMANVTVIVNSADNEQTLAKTDEDGKYSVVVIRPAGTYTVSFSMAGYVGDDEQVIFNDEDVELNVTLYSAIAADINELIANGTTRATVYTIKGQFVGNNVDLKTLRRGIYIINNRKYVVK